MSREMAVSWDHLSSYVLQKCTKLMENDLMSCRVCMRVRVRVCHHSLVLFLVAGCLSVAVRMVPEHWSNGK